MYNKWRSQGIRMLHGPPSSQRPTIGDWWPTPHPQRSTQRLVAHAHLTETTATILGSPDCPSSSGTSAQQQLSHAPLCRQQLPQVGNSSLTSVATVNKISSSATVYNNRGSFLMIRSIFFLFTNKLNSIILKHD